MIEEMVVDEPIIRFSDQQVVGSFHYGKDIETGGYLQVIQWWSQTLHLKSGKVIENCYNVRSGRGRNYPEVWYVDFPRTLSYYSPHFQAIIDAEDA